MSWWERFNDLPLNFIVITSNKHIPVHIGVPLTDQPPLDEALRLQTFKAMRSISGIDDGQRVTAAIAIDDGRHNKQGLIKRSELYAESRMKKNLTWLLRRKKANCFDVGEVEQSIRPRAVATVNEYLSYAKSRFGEGTAGALYWFYGQRVVLRHSADSAIGMRSAIDRSVSTFLAEAEGGLIVVGDSSFGTNRKGALPSLHRSWVKALSRGVNGRLARLDKKGIWMDKKDPELVPRGAFWIYRAKEFNTSKKCSRCYHETQFYHRKASQDGTPASDILRVKHCKHCGHYFHRDGMAASAIVTIAADSLLNGMRLSVLSDKKWSLHTQLVCRVSKNDFRKHSRLC